MNTIGLCIWISLNPVIGPFREYIMHTYIRDWTWSIALVTVILNILTLKLYWVDSEFLEVLAIGLAMESFFYIFSRPYDIVLRCKIDLVRILRVMGLGRKHTEIGLLHRL